MVFTIQELLRLVGWVVLVVGVGAVFQALRFRGCFRVVFWVCYGCIATLILLSAMAGRL